MALQFYSSDKESVIIELGKCFTKVGFSSEIYPRAIIRTPELQSEKVTGLGSISLASSEWADILEPLIRRLYFECLQISPITRKIILVENDFTPTVFRESLAKILFEIMRVPSIIYLSSMIAPLYLCGVTSGIIVDIGYFETRIVPICFGVPIMKAYRTIQAGSHTINKRLQQLLIEANSDITMKATTIQLLPECHLEELKAKYCYVSFNLNNENQYLNENILTQSETNNQSFTFNTLNDLFVIINPKLSIHMPSDARWKPCECLFSPVEANENDTLSEGIIHTLELCDMDIKPYVIENILVCGGGAQLPGFLQRLAVELIADLHKHPTLSTPCLINRLAFGNPNCDPFLRQWTGAAVCAAACDHSVHPIPNQFFLADWDEGKPLPDWLIPANLNMFEADTTEDILASATLVEARD